MLKLLKRKNDLIKKILLYAVMTCLAAVFVFPFFAMVTKSLMTSGEYWSATLKMFPDKMMWANYKEVFTASGESESGISYMMLYLGAVAFGVVLRVRLYQNKVPRAQRGVCAYARNNHDTSIDNDNTAVLAVYSVRLDRHALSHVGGNVVRRRRDKHIPRNAVYAQFAQRAYRKRGDRRREHIPQVFSDNTAQLQNHTRGDSGGRDSRAVERYSNSAHVPRVFCGKRYNVGYKRIGE